MPRALATRRFRMCANSRFTSHNSTLDMSHVGNYKKHELRDTKMCHLTLTNGESSQCSSSTWKEKRPRTKTSVNKDLVYDQSSNQLLKEAMSGVAAQLDFIRQQYLNIENLCIVSDKCSNFNPFEQMPFLIAGNQQNWVLPTKFLSQRLRLQNTRGCFRKNNSRSKEAEHVGRKVDLYRGTIRARPTGLPFCMDNELFQRILTRWRRQLNASTWYVHSADASFTWHRQHSRVVWEYSAPSVRIKHFEWNMLRFTKCMNIHTLLLLKRKRTESGGGVPRRNLHSSP